MDEFAEYPKAVLEVLRQPLVDRIISISKAYDRILKVAYTIADLEGIHDILSHHIIARHQPHRSLDRPSYLGSCL